jgi:hypothetical protein
LKPESVQTNILPGIKAGAHTMQTGIKAGAHTMQTGIKAGAQSMQTGVKSGLQGVQNVFSKIKTKVAKTDSS